MEQQSIRNTPYTIDTSGVVRSPTGRVISTWCENNTGYLLFRIRENKKPKCYRLHRILGETFLPNPENLPFIKHKDDNKSNNTIDNLEWGANPDNVREGYANRCYQFKQRRHKVKVTFQGVDTVFDSLRSLSETLGFNRKNVAAILKGKKTNTYEGFEFSYEMPND
ncbi:MAG: HNH endonuclease [Bacteroidales bacterium]